MLALSCRGEKQNKNLQIVIVYWLVPKPQAVRLPPIIFHRSKCDTFFTTCISLHRCLVWFSMISTNIPAEEQFTAWHFQRIENAVWQSASRGLALGAGEPQVWTNWYSFLLIIIVKKWSTTRFFVNTPYFDFYLKSEYFLCWKNSQYINRKQVSGWRKNRTKE